jgi:ubiquinone/menaquinone biosynthesis C-methylase UbiE
VSGPQIFTPEYYQRMRDLETHGWWNAAMRDVAARGLASAALPETGTLLDVGCGSGQTMSWFRRLYPQWQTMGIDISPDGLRASRAGGHGHVCGASALALPFPDASVDAVITLDVIQHLPLEAGDAHALREIHRVLRAGGTLLLRTNAQTMPRTPDDPTHLFRRYDPAQLRARLTEAGFVVQHLGRVNALLGLAEIPRDLRARRALNTSYTGLLAEPGRVEGPVDRWKRAWLRLEGRLMMKGVPLPLGRTLVAVCRR